MFINTRLPTAEGARRRRVSAPNRLYNYCRPQSSHAYRSWLDERWKEQNALKIYLIVNCKRILMHFRHCTRYLIIQSRLDVPLYIIAILSSSTLELFRHFPRQFVMLQKSPFIPKLDTACRGPPLCQNSLFLPAVPSPPRSLATLLLARFPPCFHRFSPPPATPSVVHLVPVGANLPYEEWNYLRYAKLGSPQPLYRTHPLSPFLFFFSASSLLLFPSPPFLFSKAPRIHIHVYTREQI